MKKEFLTILIVVALFSSIYSQEKEENKDPLRNKKGLYYLPEAGDYALGVDAAPFITLAGNLANINGAPTYNMNFNFLTGNNTIYGKYFLDEKTAVRAKIRINYATNTKKYFVQDDSKQYTTSFDKDIDIVEDKWNNNVKNIILGAGLEKRRGHNRLQGYYGGEVLILFATNKDKYTYGNDIDQKDTTGTHIAPSSTDCNANISPDGNTRILTNKQGTTIGFGARGFVGVEYFVFPKISLGGEFGWGLLFQKTGEGKNTQEEWDFTTNGVVEKEYKTAGSGKFIVDTDNNNLVTASVYLLFHF